MPSPGGIPRTVAWAKPGEPMCRARHRQGWMCSRLRGHRGAHVAHGDLGTAYFSWRGGRSA